MCVGRREDKTWVPWWALALPRWSGGGSNSVFGQVVSFFRWGGCALSIWFVFFFFCVLRILFLSLVHSLECSAAPLCVILVAVPCLGRGRCRRLCVGICISLYIHECHLALQAGSPETDVVCAERQGGPGGGITSGAGCPGLSRACQRSRGQHDGRCQTLLRRERDHPTSTSLHHITIVASLSARGSRCLPAWPPVAAALGPSADAVSLAPFPEAPARSPNLHLLRFPDRARQRAQRQHLTALRAPTSFLLPLPFLPLSVLPALFSPPVSRPSSSLLPWKPPFWTAVLALCPPRLSPPSHRPATPTSTRPFVISVDPSL